ncbi:MAG: Spy/CpxP family protein refolding chaperone [Rudaea sp.]
MKRGKLTQAIAALGLAIVSGAAMAQTDATTPAPGQGPNYGPGMMRGYGYGMHGYGPGMMGGYGPGMMGGYGYGPGMMGGYGGPGMMGGYGYGPGMMGGYGYGPGMMGGPGWGRGYGGGPGWGRGGALSQLDLTADQQEKIAKIQEEMRAKNWSTMGELRSEQFKLRSLYNADNPDANAIAEQQKKVDELRRTLIKSRVDAHKQMAAMLTKEQRAQLRAMGPWWLDDETDDD